MDGPSNCRGTRIRIISSLQKESEWKNHSGWVFFALNNEAKYEAVLAKLKMSRKIRADRV